MVWLGRGNHDPAAVHSSTWLQALRQHLLLPHSRAISPQLSVPAKLPCLHRERARIRRLAYAPGKCSEEPLSDRDIDNPPRRHHNEAPALECDQWNLNQALLDAAHIFSLLADSSRYSVLRSWPKHKQLHSRMAPHWLCNTLELAG